MPGDGNGPRLREESRTHMKTADPQQAPSDATATKSGNGLLVAVVLGIIRLIPRQAGLRLARQLGRALYILAPERRRVAATNLDLAFGTSLDQAAKDRITRTCFENSIALIFDFLKLSQLSPGEREAYLTVVGEEHLTEALQRGRGVLAVSAHFGNFPLLLSVIAFKGYPLHVVIRHFKSGWVDALWTGVLRRFGVGTFPRDRAAPAILRALKQGAIVGYVLDQNMQRENGFFVDFFGHRACTLKGLATFAGRYGSPILPVFIVSTPDGRHQVSIAKAFFPEDGLKDREFEITQQYTHLIEEWIRHYPEQWVWFHRRWKTRPEGEPALYPPKRGLRRAIKRLKRRLRAH